MTHPVSNQILQVTVAAGLRLVTDIVLNLATLAHYESIGDPAVIRWLPQVWLDASIGCITSIIPCEVRLARCFVVDADNWVDRAHLDGVSWSVEIKGCSIGITSLLSHICWSRWCDTACRNLTLDFSVHFNLFRLVLSKSYLFDLTVFKTGTLDLYESFEILNKSKYHQSPLTWGFGVLGFWGFGVLGYTQ